MQIVKLKTHLFIADTHEEYIVKWCGKLANTKPEFKNNLPVFVIIGSKGCMEVNTIDMKRLEECAKKLTQPQGRKAITTDIARIYIKEETGKLKLMGKVIHNHVKEFRQMYDAFEKV